MAVFIGAFDTIFDSLSGFSGQHKLKNTAC